MDKAWPDDMAGVLAAEEAAERTAQARQRRQRNIDYTLKGLRPRYLQRKAQELLMDHPNATWNNFCNQIIQTDLILEVSSNFVFHEEQAKAELATLAHEIKNLRSEWKEYHVIAVVVTPQTFHPDQQERQKPARFRKYCHENGQTSNCCRKKIRDEEVLKVRFQVSPRRKTIPIPNNSNRISTRRLQNNHNMSHFPELYYKNSPLKDCLPNEEANRQHEAEQFTTPEPVFFPRIIGMNLVMADIPSIDESDDESSDLLPLGY